jgi:hypothetical protein
VESRVGVARTVGDDAGGGGTSTLQPTADARRTVAPARTSLGRI